MSQRWVTITTRHGRRCSAVAALVLLSAGAGAQPAPASAPAGGAWPVAGRQGIIEVVIVPDAEARDRDAYVRQLSLLCEPRRTCFINFYTNSTGAPVAVPLPDAIEHEAAAVFRRSMKQNAEMMRFACRLHVDDDGCF